MGAVGQVQHALKGGGAAAVVLDKGGACGDPEAAVGGHHGVGVGVHWPVRGGVENCTAVSGLVHEEGGQVRQKAFCTVVGRQAACSAVRPEQVSRLHARVRATAGQRHSTAQRALSSSPGRLQLVGHVAAVGAEVAGGGVIHSDGGVVVRVALVHLDVVKVARLQPRGNKQQLG